MVDCTNELIEKFKERGKGKILTKYQKVIDYMTKNNYRFYKSQGGVFFFFNKVHGRGTVEIPKYVLEALQSVAIYKEQGNLTYFSQYFIVYYTQSREIDIMDAMDVSYYHQYELRKGYEKINTLNAPIEITDLMLSNQRQMAVKLAVEIWNGYHKKHSKEVFDMVIEYKILIKTKDTENNIVTKNTLTIKAEYPNTVVRKKAQIWVNTILQMERVTPNVTVGEMLTLPKFQLTNNWQPLREQVTPFVEIKTYARRVGKL